MCHKHISILRAMVNCFASIGNKYQIPPNIFCLLFKCLAHSQRGGQSGCAPHFLRVAPSIEASTQSHPRFSWVTYKDPSREPSACELPSVQLRLHFNPPPHQGMRSFPETSCAVQASGKEGGPRGCGPSVVHGDIWPRAVAPASLLWCEYTLSCGTGQLCGTKAASSSAPS